MKGLTQPRLAGLLFAFSAVGPVGKWLLLLFYLPPPGQGALDHASQMLAYVFGNQEVRLFFVVLALLPFLFLALFLAAWSSRAKGATAMFGVVATLAAAVVVWPAAITSALGTYYVYRRGAV